VVSGERPKGFEADASAHFGLGGGSAANDERWILGVRLGTNGFVFLAQNPAANSEAVYLLTSSMAAPTSSNPVPQIGSIDPSSTPQGGLGLQVTLNGQGFVEGSVVQWNGAALQTTYVSASPRRNYSSPVMIVEKSPLHSSCRRRGF
jgi:hypothetical protein